MLIESKSKKSERYLLADSRFGKESVNIWQKECRDRFVKMEKTSEYQKFLNWKENDTEIALFTLYAYADFKIPKSFNFIFNTNNLEEYCKTNITLSQSIWEGWYPINYVDHGHKHLIILKFEERIPKLIFDLHEETQKISTVPKNTLRIGICQFEDYKLIKKKIESIKNEYEF